MCTGPPCETLARTGTVPLDLKSPQGYRSSYEAVPVELYLGVHRLLLKGVGQRFESDGKAFDPFNQGSVRPGVDLVHTVRAVTDLDRVHAAGDLQHRRREALGRHPLRRETLRRGARRRGALRQLVIGGNEYGNLTLTRFYSLHMLVIPGALIGLITLHLYLVVRLGVSSPPWSPDEAGRDLDLDELCDEVLRVMLTDRPEDDVALVAVRLLG